MQGSWSRLWAPTLCPWHKFARWPPQGFSGPVWAAWEGRGGGGVSPTLRSGETPRSSVLASPCVWQVGNTGGMAPVLGLLFLLGTSHRCLRRCHPHAPGPCSIWLWPWVRCQEGFQYTCGHVPVTGSPSPPTPSYSILTLALEVRNQKPQPRATERRSILMYQLLAVPG